MVEVNTAHAWPRIESAIRRAGLAPTDIDLVIVTHAHLDHAAGAGHALERCPNAQLLAHPKAARHLIDPTRLITSARAVYGADSFARLYGEVLPVPANRVRAMQDEEEFRWQHVTLRFLHTLGHASHHACVHVPEEKLIFTGDAFGLAYPRFRSVGAHGLIFPSTSPTDFDHEEALRAYQRIVDTGATHAALTHFGVIERLDAVAEQLREHLEVSTNALFGGASQAEIQQTLTDHFRHWFESNGYVPTDLDWDFLKLDLELNAQGIAFTASKRDRPKT